MRKLRSKQLANCTCIIIHLLTIVWFIKYPSSHSPFPYRQVSVVALLHLYAYGVILDARAKDGCADANCLRRGN